MITNIAPTISTTISASNEWSPDQVFYVLTIIGMIAAVVEYIVNNRIEESKIRNNSKMSTVILLGYMFFAGLKDDLPRSIQPYIMSSLTKGKMIIGNVWMEECDFLYIRLLDRREIKVNSDYITFIEKCSIKNEIKALKEEILVIADKVQDKAQLEIYKGILIDRLKVLKQMLAYANTEDVIKKDVKNKDIERALGKFKNCFAQSFKCENEVDKKLKECAHYLDKIIECFKEEYKLPEYKKRSLK